MLLNRSDIKTREVLEWKGLHLFHYDLSSCSQKVRILMGELGIEYTSHPINLMRNEQRTDWYLGINSCGMVPVLVHDGDVHIESNDIIEYLDRQFAGAGNSLLPTTDDEQQMMYELMSLENQLHQDLRTVTFTYLAPDPSGHAPSMTENDLSYIGRFHDGCTLLNDKLQDRLFLLGERMSLADISWFITLYRLHLAGYPLRHYPELQAYYERIARRAAFRKQVAAGPLIMRLAMSVYRRLNRMFRCSLPSNYERWRDTEKLAS